MNTPFQPPVAGGAGQNKTLAIVSMVLGILGLTICCGSWLISIAALVTGFMARGKIAENPAEYGGGGMATAGIITGGLGVLLSIVITILYFVGGLASVMTR